MKILKNRTYRRLRAAERDLELLKEKCIRLDADCKTERNVNDWIQRRNDQLRKELTEAQNELSRRKQKRDQAGQFTK